jgi:hypothetical protein
VALTLVQATNIAGVALELALAAALLALNFNHRANRALALFMVLRGLVVADIVLAGVADTPAGAAFWWRFYPYFFALWFVTLYFASVWPHGRSRRGRLAGLACLAAGAAVAAVYAASHALVWGASGPHPDGSFGPLGALFGTYNVVYALVVAVFARDYARAEAGPRRESILLISLGFATLSVYNAVVALTVPAEPSILVLTRRGLSPLVSVASLGLIAGTAGYLLREASRRPNLRGAKGPVRYALALLAVAATALLVAASAPGEPRVSLDSLLFGLWGPLLQPLLVTYAVVRCQLFDIDLKVKWTIRRGTLAAVFLVVFFVVAQLAQNVLSAEFGLVAGGVAAGLLLFAISPLQRFAERVADTAMPGVKGVGDMTPSERTVVYREAARQAWSDGHLDASERAMLDRLRGTLRLGTDEASRLESEASKG